MCVLKREKTFINSVKYRFSVHDVSNSIKISIDHTMLFVPLIWCGLKLLTRLVAVRRARTWPAERKCKQLSESVTRFEAKKANEIKKKTISL